MLCRHVPLVLKNGRDFFSLSWSVLHAVRIPCQSQWKWNHHMARLLSCIKKILVKEEEGATMVEYGIMIALIAIVCIAAVTTLGNSIKAVFEDIAADISGI